jgi:hypothetical protein
MEAPGKDSIQARQSAQMVCPHCQTKGSVTTRREKLKKGISGGKAVGALMTAGLSVLVTGLSRKENVTEATCSNCGAVWAQWSPQKRPTVVTSKPANGCGPGRDGFTLICPVRASPFLFASSVGRI